MRASLPFGAVVGVVLTTWYMLVSCEGPVQQAFAQTSPKQTAKIDRLEQQFAKTVKPFLDRYCLSCHGAVKQKASFDLSRDTTVAAVAKNHQQWEAILMRLHAAEMPPASATAKPKAAETAAVMAWIRDLLDHEAARNAGDPGIVLARRLSNAEYDNTIRDLTGVDIRPTREFPVDPANQAGFDNSGESLAMSPALLKKYLTAARHVAEHVALKPEGFAFAPHPVAAETDRDKYCVQRIVDFYKRHSVDLADYFLAAWHYRHRAQLGRPDADLKQFAIEAGLSAKYLSQVWSSLNGAEPEIGPLAIVCKLWQELPASASIDAKTSPNQSARPRLREGCEQMRDLVVRLRKQLKPEIKKLSAPGISAGSQTLVLWKNNQLAGRHRDYCGDVAQDLKKLAEQLKGSNEKYANVLALDVANDSAKQNMSAALERFCNVFPDAFVVIDRGPYFDAKAAGQGRPLTAGFHLMQGYFRDDLPLCELILDEAQRRQLDALWQELNFITLAPQRQYADFIFFERAEPPRFMFEAEFDFARSEDKDCSSVAKMEKLAELYLAKARKKGASDDALQAIQAYFTNMSTEIRRVEKARLAAEPSHLDALVTFAERAYRRPLRQDERDDLLAFYRKSRQQDDPGHEEALRDALVSVLMSPHFCYRIIGEPSRVSGRVPLSDYELASRLSYFLWSSMPDAELLAHAQAGDLRQPKILTAQTQRVLRDPKVRGLATEFAGNWLDMRRFEEHNAVDRQRFPTFTNELRQAMYEEPIRFFMDIARNNRSALDMLYAKDTFVNPLLAKHYGMPIPSSKTASKQVGAAGPARLAQPTDDWFQVADADRYGRGGLLPMAVFLTKNSPGLRTSPVKRGYWVVRRLLGEHIPPPPPTVPELPTDEAKTGELTLPQVLARHRADQSCAGCHKRFDAVGVVFESFGPIGERRAKDLAGRPVQTAATFPDGKDRDGISGLRAYLKEKRQDDFVDNLCKKMFSYALGRSLQLSDKQTIEEMKAKLAADQYALGAFVEAIVASPQFLNKQAQPGVRE